MCYGHYYLWLFKIILIIHLETVKAICSEYKIHNADITLRYDATVDDLRDVIEGSRIYTPCIYVVNKIDHITLEELEILDKLPYYCPVSLYDNMWNDRNSLGSMEAFLEYADVDGSTNAHAGLNGQKFDGNQVVAIFYPENKFAQEEYDG